MKIHALVLLTLAGCGKQHAHQEDAVPTSSATLALPLTAGATVVGRLSAGEPCLPTYTMTVGGLLHTAGEPAAGDEVHFGYDPHDRELSLGVKYEGRLTHEFDTFPKDQAGVDLVSSTLKAGETLQLTVQPSCARDGALLVDFIDLSPHPFNPEWKDIDFLSLATPTSFGVVFSYDDVLSWQATWTTAVSQDVVAKLPATIHYAVYDTEAMALATPWRPIEREALVTGQVKITDRLQVKRIVPHQAHVQLVFDTGTGFDFLDTDYLCTQQPKLFKNLTQSGKTCSQVVDADVPR